MNKAEIEKEKKKRKVLDWIVFVAGWINIILGWVFGLLSNGDKGTYSILVGLVLILYINGRLNLK